MGNEQKVETKAASEAAENARAVEKKYELQVEGDIQDEKEALRVKEQGQSLFQTKLQRAAERLNSAQAVSKSASDEMTAAMDKVKAMQERHEQEQKAALDAVQQTYEDKKKAMKDAYNKKRNEL